MEPGRVVSCRIDAMYIRRTYGKDTSLRGVFLYIWVHLIYGGWSLEGLSPVIMVYSIHKTDP